MADLLWRLEYLEPRRRHLLDECARWLCVSDALRAYAAVSRWVEWQMAFALRITISWETEIGAEGKRNRERGRDRNRGERGG